MKEWNNPWNPFNSMKILLHRSHLEACAQENYLTPISVNIDPTNKCNFKCCFCNSFDTVKDGKDELSEEHMIKLADFLGQWGADTPEGHPKSVYITGGGEPLQHPSTPALLERLHQNSIQSAIITNGTFLNDESIDIIVKTCRWIGVSVDAVTCQTFNKMKGLPSKSKVLDLVIENIKKLVKRSKELGTGCDIGFKFLLHPFNYHEIYLAAELARNLGVQDFHLRPVRYTNFTRIDENEIDFKNPLVQINKLFEKIHELNSDTFHVYGVRHKFNPDLSIKKNFSRCRVIPIQPTFGADGNVYCCFDMRGRYPLCTHYPDVSEIAKIWNTEEHKKIVNSIKVKNCPGCTFGVYNEIIENVILKDSMCRNFP